MKKLNIILNKKLKVNMHLILNTNIFEWQILLEKEKISFFWIDQIIWFK